MKENQFNTEIKNSLEEQGAWAYKIPDSPTSWTAHRTRFTPEKPCDIVGCYKSVGFLIEGKQSKKFEAFNINEVRASQQKNMDMAVDKGNRAFIFLNVRIAKPYENRLIIMDWAEVRDSLRNESIKAKQIKELPYTTGKKGRFDLSEFLEGL